MDSAQDPPMLAPAYRGDPASSSLLYDSDFYLTKPTTDLLLHGHAYAPGGKPTTRVKVSMQVGEVTKTLSIVGDRLYQKGMAGIDTEWTQPFTKMPVTYERAYGGHEPIPVVDPNRPRYEARNPVGVGFSPTPGQSSPNIEYPELSLKGKPAGFGPIPAHWHPRIKYAGTYDEKWKKNRLPLYPEDLDDRFFLCSPEDQRPREFLRGGEPVELINLTPEGRLVFVLPRIAFRFETEFRGKPSVTHRGVLHTVILEPDFPRIVMVWHSTLRAHADVHRLIQTFVSQLRVINPPPGSLPVGGDTIDDETE